MSIIDIIELANNTIITEEDVYNLKLRLIKFDNECIIKDTKTKLDLDLTYIL